MKTCHLSEKVIEHIFGKFEGMKAGWKELIFSSFLPDKMQEAYSDLIDERAARLFPDRVK